MFKIPLTEIVLFPDPEPADFLAPELDSAAYIEAGDIIAYTAPSGNIFTGAVLDTEYDETSYAPDGWLGVTWVTLNLWYANEDDAPRVMRRVVPSEDVSLILKSNALD